MTDHCHRTWTDISGDEGTSRSICMKSIRDLLVHSPFGVFISSTIMINITCCSGHHIQLWRIIYNCSQYSGMPWESSPSRYYHWICRYCRFSTTPYPAAFNASSSSFWLLSWSTTTLPTSSGANLCCRKQFWWLKWKSQIIFSLIVDHKSMTSQMDTIWAKGAHTIGKCRLGLPSEDIHLYWIWNLWNRTGVMLWSLILSGTSMILSSWTLFLFSTALCASSVISFCHHA